MPGRVVIRSASRAGIRDARGVPSAKEGNPCAMAGPGARQPPRQGAIALPPWGLRQTLHRNPGAVCRSRPLGRRRRNRRLRRQKCRFRRAASCAFACEGPGPGGERPEGGRGYPCRWQATAWPGAAGRRAGVSARQGSMAKGQRSVRGHPTRPVTGVSVSPRRRRRSRRRPGSGMGAAGRWEWGCAVYRKVTSLCDADVPDHPET